MNDMTTLATHEAVIENGKQTFIEVGNALMAIRDERLYKQDYKTFEQYCKERWGFSRQHGYRLIDAAKMSPTGDKIPETEGEARQMMAEQKRPHVAHNSGENEWYTPPEYIESARQVMGEINTDPASNAIAQQAVKADNYYSKEDDGLVKDWPGKVWMNPPYAKDLIGPFMEKVTQTEEATVLVNNATDTQWFQQAAEKMHAFCFIRGRVKFLKPDGSTGAPLQGQVVMYRGPKPQRFADVFSQYGLVVLHA